MAGLDFSIDGAMSFLYFFCRLRDDQFGPGKIPERITIFLDEPPMGRGAMNAYKI